MHKSNARLEDKRRTFQSTTIDFGSLPDDALIRRPTVMRLTSMSRTSIYRRVADGTFPRPVTIPGTEMVAWYVGDIRRWLASAGKRSGNEP